jgi:hypothetical protein
MCSAEWRLVRKAVATAKRVVAAITRMMIGVVVYFAKYEETSPELK